MAIVLSLCVAYVAYCLGTNPAGPLTTPDSFHYLNATPIVPLGYPAFLKITGAGGAIVVQPILFGAALAFLGREIVRHTHSTLLAVVTIAGIMALPQLRGFHASILSESLFLTLSIVFLALAVRFTYHPTWHLMVLIAITIGLDATVRRTAVAFVPVMVFMVLLQRDRLRGSQAVGPVSLAQGKPAFFLVAALAPIGVILGAEQAVAPIVHGGHPSSLMGRHMFAKAALLDAPPAARTNDPVLDGLNQHLETMYQPIRTVLAEAPREIRGVLSIYYETCLQGGCADRSRDLMPSLDEADQTRTMGTAGLARIRRAPLAFLDLTALNYESLWTVDRLRYPGRAEALTAFVAAHRPMPYELVALSLKPEYVMEFQPSPRVRYMQWVMNAIAFWTAALAILGLYAALRSPRLPPIFAVAATAALCAHAGLLLTAVLAAGFSRFMQGLWPSIVVATVLGAWSLATEARRRRGKVF